MCNPAQTAQAKYRLPARGHFENLAPDSNIIKVSVLLPSNDSLVPDVKKAGAGIIQGLETARNRSLINENLKFKLTFRETKCNNIYGPKSFTDAVVEGVDVLFGPSCEYALGKFEII